MSDWAEQKALDIMTRFIGNSHRVDIVAQALRDERERCAKIVEEHIVDSRVICECIRNSK